LTGEDIMHRRAEALGTWFHLPRMSQLTRRREVAALSDMFRGIWQERFIYR